MVIYVHGLPALWEGAHHRCLHMRTGLGGSMAHDPLVSRSSPKVLWNLPPGKLWSQASVKQHCQAQRGRALMNHAGWF